ncbi:hypothetical protein [Clostridium perfringens]|uniref:Uncharacterized protein n=1 Tax=Clostridium perfringens TaxID=1502 RepID=A0AAP4EEH1_CLOPF|nr:hypothetical protein [Clostridium perfringens]MDH2337052.1 hypothetical protein [Clostridium perfringens]
MIKVKSKQYISNEMIEKLEKELSKKCNEEVVIFPYGLEIMDSSISLKECSVREYEGLEKDCDKSFIEEMIDVEEEQSENNLVINVSAKIDEESFEILKKKIIEIKKELNNEKICEVIIKDTYIYDYICSMGENANIDFIKDQWNKISNGFNFVIKFKDEYYSVEKFNEVIRG